MVVDSNTAPAVTGSVTLCAESAWWNRLWYLHD